MEVVFMDVQHADMASWCDAGTPTPGSTSVLTPQCAGDSNGNSSRATLQSPNLYDGDNFAAL